MKYKSFSTIFLLLISMIVFLIISFNYIINPSTVFNHNLLNLNETEKDNYQRIIKFRDLKLNYNKYQSFIIGTSRSNVFQSLDLEYFTKDKVYNASINASYPCQQYRYLDYIIKHYKINYIVLSLDFFSYNPNNICVKNTELTRIKNNSLYSDYKSLLLSSNITKASLLTLRNNLFKYEKKKHSFENTLKGFEITKYLYNEKEFQSITSIDYQFKFLQKMILLLKNKNIKFKVYISPISFEQFKLIEKVNLKDTYNYWLLKVAKLTEFYDFSGFNSITNNKNNYYDSSHAYGFVGKMIFQQLFDHNNQNDFGIIVNQNNVQAHIEKLWNY